MLYIIHDQQELENTKVSLLYNDVVAPSSSSSPSPPSLTKSIRNIATKEDNFLKNHCTTRNQATTMMIIKTPTRGFDHDDNHSLDDMCKGVIKKSMDEEESPAYDHHCRRKKRRRRRRKRSNSSSCSESHDKDSAHVPLPDHDQYVAMDCEMVGVGLHGHDSIIARVTIIDWYENILYDQYIQPQQPVTDYRTPISGITQDHLNNATITMETCRQQVSNLLRNKILIGHGLKSDLQCLGIYHPWEYIRDTTKYSSYMRYDDCHQLYYPRKLRDIYFDIFQVPIQNQYHSSYEDSVAALHLYQYVQYNWECIMKYKIEKTNAIVLQQQQQQQQQ